VFTLFELEGMTGDDVAEVLGIPLGTAYSRLRLARESFRKAVRLLSVQAAAGRAP
jgi:RNA polymerase sigma-70 factor (ECF subfamily)